MTDDDPHVPDFDDDDEAEGAERQEPEPGTPDSAADPARIKKQERRAELDAREADDFWHGVFASPVGRREMWKLLMRAGIKDARFAAGPTGFPDPHATFFRAGIKSVSDDFLDEWTIRDFEGVTLMRMEHDSRFPKKKPDAKKAKR